MNNVEKTELYNSGKESLDILKKAGGKDQIRMRMSIPERTHFKIQNLKQNKNKKIPQALPKGKVFRITAHQAFVNQYAVTRDGKEERKAQEAMEANQNQQEKETEAFTK